MNAKVAQLLEERERKGLRVVLTFRIFFVGVTISLTFFTAQTSWEWAAESALLLVIGALTVASLFLVRSARWMPRIGVGGVLMDLVVLSVLPFVWHSSVGGDLVSRAYLLKLTNVTVISFALLVLNSLATRALYPAMIVAGVTLVHGCLFWYATRDPRVVFVPDYAQHMLGPTVRLDLFISPLVVFVIVGVCLSFFTQVARRTVVEAARLENRNLQVSRYFSPAVYEKIANAEDAFFVQPGRSQPIAILFSDLRGFTTLSEAMPPEEVIRFLQEYHERMVAIIFRNGGTLDKFVGDAIMATFGTPEPHPEAAARAVRAAVEMSAALVDLNEARGRAGEPPLRQGIGVHFGSAVVGNIGSSARLEFTAIGDAVNIASRVESTTKETDSDILITADVMAQLNDAALAAHFVSKGEFQLKGRVGSMALFGLRAQSGGGDTDAPANVV
jgi:adenylate cyclase